ncbi:MAG: phosphoglycerate kinase [Acidimicrobiia bacterium]|nr:phosphoglycerate kinase [Acidimicrobiia bacterium]NNL28463.1 phosphoglycerate kinase [Acidimicrobiia bacterium]
MLKFANLDDLPPDAKTVLVRSDLNVPMYDGAISDDFRIRSAVPTLEALAERGAKVVVMSHFGRPDKKSKKYSLEPVADRLADMTQVPVGFVASLVGRAAKTAIAEMAPGSILVLENTRFQAGETANDGELAAKLSGLADAFVLDAFGTAHRAHASTVGVGEHLPSFAGLLLQKELEAIGTLLEEPPRPFVVLLGGAKVSDKIAVLTALLPRVDAMLIGGGMCFTLMKAAGIAVGTSLLEDEMVPRMRELLASADGAKIVLPEDIVVAAEFAEDADPLVVAAGEIPKGSMGLDIGPITASRYSDIIKEARSVFWNGPMGVFEWPNFRAGTEAVAHAVAKSDAFSVVGGGDSVAALRLLELEDEVSFVSTGGGAGLELLEGQDLPGLAMLERSMDNHSTMDGARDG